jgi:hypothetical protein
LISQYSNVASHEAPPQSNVDDVRSAVARSRDTSAAALASTISTVPPHAVTSAHTNA